MCNRPLFGLEPSQMSFLYFLMYAAAAGGLLPLLESNEGSAQELKLKVHSSYCFLECVLLTCVGVTFLLNSIKMPLNTVCTSQVLHNKHNATLCLSLRNEFIVITWVCFCLYFMQLVIQQEN